MANIAVEGIMNDIVPVICEILEKGGHKVCFRNESAFRNVDSSSIDAMIDSKPDIVVICNAEGYLKFLETYSKKTSIPAVVLTGGDPNLVAKAKSYTPHVVTVPLDIHDFYREINSILPQKDN